MIQDDWIEWRKGVDIKYVNGRCNCKGLGRVGRENMPKSEQVDRRYPSIEGHHRWSGRSALPKKRIDRWRCIYEIKSPALDCLSAISASLR